MKIDPYNNQEGYLEWKRKISSSGRIEKLSESNSEILLKFLDDMEIGINVGMGAKKGSRSFIRLKSLRDKLAFLFKKTEELFDLQKIYEVSEVQLHSIFSYMENGKITKVNGERYKAVGDYVKIFKTFWHWYQKINKKNSIEIKDITSDLNAKSEKPDWVYLTDEQIRSLCDKAKYEYKVLIMFLFDTGIRAPTELMNIKVSDFFNEFKELNIREEISKTFGRRIKLMLSSELIKEYVKVKNLKATDFVFDISPPCTNRYLRRLAEKLFGDKPSEAGQKYSELTMYDFRHCSCCYWLPRYKSESALKYRFGWKSSDKIHYYSELLGMRDTISEDDMLVDVTKTEIEQRLMQSEKKGEILQERLDNIEKYLEKYKYVLTKIQMEVQ